MHVARYGFKGVTTYLSAPGGTHAPPGATGAATVAHQTPAFRRWAERSEPLAFGPSKEDAGRWGQVRSYLVEECCLPATFVDALHG